MQHRGRVLSGWRSVADICVVYFGRIRGKARLTVPLLNLTRATPASSNGKRVPQSALENASDRQVCTRLNAVAAPLAGDSGVGVVRFSRAMPWECDLERRIFSRRLSVQRPSGGSAGYAQRLGSGILFLLVHSSEQWIL